MSVLPRCLLTARACGAGVVTGERSIIGQKFSTTFATEVLAAAGRQAWPDNVRIVLTHQGAPVTAIHDLTTHRCSFCGKDETDVAHLVAGPGAYICSECVDHCVAVISGRPGDFRSLDDRTDDELLEDVARIALSRDQVEEAVADRVRRLRERRVTWARIGATLGISRQSAWERFSTDDD
jgi:ClpX C4-type zinc finger